MRLLDIALKDLRQMLRDRRSLLFLVAMPIGFTFFMAFAYRGQQSDPAADHRLVLAWVDQDGAATLGQALADRLAGSDAVRLEPMDEAAALEAVRQKTAAGALIIPAGFSAGRRTGGTPQLVLVTDSASTTGQSLYQVLRAPVTQVMSAVEIANISVEALASATTLDAAARAAEFEAAFQTAQAKWAAANNSARVQTRLAAAPKVADPYGGNPYNQASPGILVQFVIFGLVTSAQILLQERKTRTLQRMLTTSLSPAAAVGGHFLAMFTLTLLQEVLLVGFGQIALGVDYLRELLGLLLVMVALALCTASLGLLIGVLAQQDQQVVLFSLIAMFVFSALGGTWFPLEVAGQAFATVGRLTPMAWAMTGFQNIVIRGLDFSSTWLPAGVLAVFTLGFFALAVWRFRAD